MNYHVQSMHVSTLDKQQRAAGKEWFSAIISRFRNGHAKAERSYSQTSLKLVCLHPVFLSDSPVSLITRIMVLIKKSKEKAIPVTGRGGL
jgi:hypothetical protein